MGIQARATGYSKESGPVTNSGNYEGGGVIVLLGRGASKIKVISG